MQALKVILCAARPAFRDSRIFSLAWINLLATIICLGRHTITGTLTTCGRHLKDWSATYRLFERDRIKEKPLFAPIIAGAVALMSEDECILACIDDTVLRRRGKRVAHSKWCRDAQGPPFAHQLCWGQRLLQICLLVPGIIGKRDNRRAIPVGSTLLKVVPKPRKSDPPEKARELRKAADDQRSTVLAVHAAQSLRTSLNEQGYGDRKLRVAVDGGFTNKTFFSSLPQGTEAIGRLRKDAVLRGMLPPGEGEKKKGRGRPKVYGEKLPTPEELYQNKDVPCVSVFVYAAGALREFKTKTYESCYWPTGRGERPVKVVVLQPLEALHNHQKRLYFSHPGFLVSSNPALSTEKIIEAYVSRWEIEVGFRDQKNDLGLDEAQVRTEKACEGIVRWRTFCYAALMLAGARSNLGPPPKPAWQKPASGNWRPSVPQLQRILRGEIWNIGIEGNYSGFAGKQPQNTNPEIINFPLEPAVLFAQR
jgi:hypothetical protein